MRHIHFFALLYTIFTFVLSSCNYTTNEQDDWITTETNDVDTIDFRKKHHYSHNHFFEVTDTILVLNNRTDNTFSGLKDSIYITEKSIIAVIDIKNETHDDQQIIWIRVAKDALIQGWIKENELLSRIVPDNIISKCIYWFSKYKTIFFVVITIISCTLIFILRHKKIPFKHDIIPNGFYPTLLNCTVAFTTLIYGTISTYALEAWIEYYYNPTLNPLTPNLPVILRLFIFSVWLILILFIATIDDFIYQRKIKSCIIYFITFPIICVLSYLIFTLSIPYHIAYPLFVLYIVFLASKHFSKKKTIYHCGICNSPLETNGKCKECDIINNIQRKHRLL